MATAADPLSAGESKLDKFCFFPLQATGIKSCLFCFPGNEKNLKAEVCDFLCMLFSLMINDTKVMLSIRAQE